MAKSNQVKNRKFRRDRRGVGAIMGGVLLVAILLTTMLLYFITILDNDQRRASYDIQSAQVNQDKSAEALEASRDQDLFTNGTGSYINAVLNNDGSLPLIVSYAALFCIDDDCPTPNNPIIAQTDKTLNAKEVTTRHVGPVSDDLNYRVDFITERGNIVSTEECVVDLAAGICTNEEADIPDFIISADPKSIVIEVGNSGPSTITVTSLSGFSSDVALSASSPDGGNIVGSFNPSSVTPSGTSSLTITTAEETTPGTYTMIITGVGGSISHSTSVSVTVIEPVDIDGAVNEGIIQGTGSIQLDFKAFGSIYPQLGSRAGVDQRGWDVKVSSPYGSATGYPAFDIQTIINANTQVVLVEKARNLDPSGEDLIMTRTTGLLTSNDQTQGTPPSSNYICKEDKPNKRLLEYNEGANRKELPATPISAAKTVGWQELFFCSTSPSDGTGDQITTFWTPANKFSALNGIFMVARGIFETVNAPYAQTIPYQAISPGKGNNPDNPLNICLRDDSFIGNNACPGLTTGCDDTNNCGATFNPSSLRYTALVSEMQSGVQVRLHVNNPNSDFSNNDKLKITWLYPDGTYTDVTEISIASLDSNRNSAVFTLPTTQSDGTSPIQCSGGPGTSEFYTMVVTSEYNTQAKRYVYYMTWEMQCKE
jgi:hypothetical protein